MGFGTIMIDRFGSWHCFSVYIYILDKFSMLPYSYTVTLLILTYINVLLCDAIFCPLNKIFSAEDS